MKYYLAVDIGASSGRHIVGWKENGKILTEEVYRFPNGVSETNGHLTWNIESLVFHVKKGIDEALARFPVIDSLSVDTWGVDYVLMKGDQAVEPCYAYRDSRTEESIPQVHRLMPFEELYCRTGIQFQPFNTIYQLYHDKMTGRLEGVTDFLLMPEYLLYRLCGVKGHEYTNATTGGMVNAANCEYDAEIIQALGLPKQLFHKLDAPGKALGLYQGIRCVLCATHDTGSAVAGIPMEKDGYFLSSGTWSVLGAKAPKAITNEKSLRTNFSNEGGVGYIRYLKNIMGMWLVNRLRDELCPGKPFPEIVEESERDGFDGLVDASDPSFMAPESMKKAFDAMLDEKPVTNAGYFRCAYRSLAVAYRKAIDEIKENTGLDYDTLYIVGGGAKNRFLNRLTEEETGIRVVALPIEATALGNLQIQMEG